MFDVGRGTDLEHLMVGIIAFNLTQADTHDSRLPEVSGLQKNTQHDYHPKKKAPCM